MKFLFDLHTHTIASGHAYSTLQENIAAAKAAGLLAYGHSDHTKRIPGAPEEIWFRNFRVIPKEIDGMRILNGAEVNIYDFEGHYDLSERAAKRLDYLIASLHPVAYESGTREQNTETVVLAMDDPYVRIIGHPDDDRYPVDTDILAAEAKKRGVLLELNNSSLKPGNSRVNGKINAEKMLYDCMKHGTRIVVNTDSHISFTVGKFAEAEEMLLKTGFPEELIANTDMSRLDWIIGPKAAY